MTDRMEGCFKEWAKIQEDFRAGRLQDSKELAIHIGNLKGISERDALSYGLVDQSTAAFGSIRGS